MRAVQVESIVAAVRCAWTMAETAAQFGRTADISGLQAATDATRFLDGLFHCF